MIKGAAPYTLMLPAARGCGCFSILPTLLALLVFFLVLSNVWLFLLSGLLSLFFPHFPVLHFF